MNCVSLSLKLRSSMLQLSTATHDVNALFTVRKLSSLTVCKLPCAHSNSPGPQQQGCGQNIAFTLASSQHKQAHAVLFFCKCWQNQSWRSQTSLMVVISYNGNTGDAISQCGFSSLFVSRSLCLVPRWNVQSQAHRSNSFVCPFSIQQKEMIKKRLSGKTDKRLQKVKKRREETGSIPTFNMTGMIDNFYWGQGVSCSKEEELVRLKVKTG